MARSTIGVDSVVWDTFHTRVETLKLAAVFEDWGPVDNEPVYDSRVSEFLDSCMNVRTCAITDNFY